MSATLAPDESEINCGRLTEADRHAFVRKVCVSFLRSSEILLGGLIASEYHDSLAESVWQDVRVP